MHKIAVEDFLHAPGGVVRKAAHVEALYKAAPLHEEDYEKVGENQAQHVGKGGVLPGDVEKTLRHLALIVGACQETDVVDKAGDGDDGQNWPLGGEIGSDYFGVSEAVYALLPFGTALFHRLPPKASSTKQGM